MYIVSIKVRERIKEIPEVQEVLTKYGDNINSRLGIHNLEGEAKGLIIVTYTNEDIEEFVEDLNKIGDIDVNYMEV